jgi:hypothetical protein
MPVQGFQSVLAQNGLPTFIFKREVFLVAPTPIRMQARSKRLCICYLWESSRGIGEVYPLLRIGVKFRRDESMTSEMMGALNNIIRGYLIFKQSRRSRRGRDLSGLILPNCYLP